MLRRNLIYTAITRSKQSLILCGEVDALKMGVERADELSRQTTLCQKLQESITASTKVGGNPEPITSKANNRDDDQLVTVLSYEQEIMQEDPMVGMENVSPYDFIVND
jgi:exodeoxyribonuclease V alpha subunit